MRNDMTGEGEYELIELFGKLMLFSNGRIRPHETPQGLNLYHLRESDDGSRFASIEKDVLVNHGGSILSKDEIDLGKSGRIDLDNGTYLNFLGEEVSLAGYLAGGFDYGHATETMDNGETGGMELK